MNYFHIYSSRFGKIPFQEENWILFPSGILGSCQLRTFILIKPPEEKLFIWLQSCQEPRIAFPLLSSQRFFPKLSFNISRFDLEFLHASFQENLSFFNIVHIPSNQPKKMTVNLRAPIALNWKKTLENK